MLSHFAEHTPVIQLGIAFLFGVLASFTPCVYPLIPVTLAIFGAHHYESRLTRFSLALTYVFGISVTYTTLGLIAARSGVVFGSFLGSPIVAWTEFALLILLAAYTLEIFHIHATSKLQNAANKFGGRGYLGAFIMGTVSGFVAAPCVGPPLVAILLVAAKSQSLILGPLLLLCYSFGLGMLFLLIGTFSGLIDRIPTSGNWLLVIKFALAVALLVVAVVAILPVLPPSLSNALASPVSIIGCAVLGAALALIGLKNHHPIAKSFGAACFALALLPVLEGPAAPTIINWRPTIEAGLLEAKATNSLIMVDLAAEWCAACKELSEKTFANPVVSAKLSELITVQMDFTDPDSEQNRKVATLYKVIGLPCVMFLRPDGSEITDNRISGFVPPDEFLGYLAKLK
jgi:thiol:disulfide interchange protein DsbD